MDGYAKTIIKERKTRNQGEVEEDIREGRGRSRNDMNVQIKSENE